jgi:hypothetical protein
VNNKARQSFAGPSAFKAQVSGKNEVDFPQNPG